jgi:uncharacterized protein (DUF2235 family)
MPQATSAPAETIVLFSDGTGNSSAKLFKTNVWRMYQAVDLGPTRSGKPVQVAYYDNGIGTQSIKLLAVLAGIFGIGLKANVLRLYRFACRNGTGDCQFFCFGFSRGAFTIRLVAAMLAKYGLVDYQSEAELNARTLDTFRDFMRDNNPNVAAFVGRIGRWVRDGLLAVWRATPPNSGFKGPATYRPARVRFVGVWDTVAAYGGPIAEITRGIDDYLWPLTMTDSCLNPNVELARHALSIDDERDAFWPVLWDEVDWHAKAQAAHPNDPAKQEAFRARLNQVWFAGMHADVGGGYPDESLSYVSLVWMMNEAEEAGLRLLPEQKKAVSDLANSLGPIHNSRGGLGVYYRPQPRKIAAFLHPNSGMDYEDATLSLRDPVIGELPKPPHGVLLGCRVHESVVARLVEGTDDYAPATFPADISIEPYSQGAKRGGNPIVDPAVIARLTARDDRWYDRQERIWDFVLFRRIAYFAAVAATVALVSMPLWVDNWPLPREQDGRAVMQRLTSWSQYVPVAWLNPWIRAFEVNWVVFALLFLAAVAFSWLGGRLQGMAHTASYALWRDRIGSGPLAPIKPGWLTRARNSKHYQRALQVVKWRILPALAALFLVLAIVWIGLAGVTQVIWAFKEPQLCAGQHPKPANRNTIFYETADPCAALATVKRGHRYEIAVHIEKPWRDDGLMVVPTGSRAGVHMQAAGADGDGWKRFRQALGIPYRRLIDGRYLQPIVKLRAYDNTAGMVPRTVVHLLNPVTTGNDIYVDTFDAPEDGELFFFVNDAAFLAEHGYFYANNGGTAWVTVTDLTAGRRGRERTALPPGS